jgi:hypothetical protein
MKIIIYDSGQQYVLDIPDDDPRELHEILDEFKKKTANQEEQLWLPLEKQSS